MSTEVSTRAPLSAAPDLPASVDDTPSALRARTRRGRRRKRLVAVALQVAILVAFLVAWEVAVRQGAISELFVSRPTVVWTSLGAYVTGPDLLLDSWQTISETMVGFALGAVGGLVVGLMLGRFELFRWVAGPYLTALNALPRVALAPLFILWFGIGMSSKVYLVASVVFFIVMIATESGIRTVDPDLLMMGRAMGTSEHSIFLKIVLPASVPAVFSGLKLGAVYALLSAIFGEMLAGQAGWGQKIALYSQGFEPGSVFAVLIVVLAFALLLNALMSAGERWFLRWQR